MGFRRLKYERYTSLSSTNHKIRRTECNTSKSNGLSIWELSDRRLFTIYIDIHLFWKYEIKNERAIIPLPLSVIVYTDMLIVLRQNIPEFVLIRKRSSRPRMWCHVLHQIGNLWRENMSHWKTNTQLSNLLFSRRRLSRTFDTGVVQTDLSSYWWRFSGDQRYPKGN